MDPKTEVPVGTEQLSPLPAQPEAMGEGLLPAAPPKVEPGVGAPSSTPEAATQTENIQLSQTEMDAAMRQGALDGKAILEPAPANVAGNALSGNELLKTPGQSELNATHQQMVAQKVEASQTPQKLPIHKRFLGALGFGGSKSETPVAAVTPDHLVATPSGTLETPQMPNFGQAGTESASIATQSEEAAQGPATAGQTATVTPESAASTLGEMTAITPPVEAAAPAGEVASPAALDAPDTEATTVEDTVNATDTAPATSLSQDMENAGEHPATITVEPGAISSFPTTEPNPAPIMAPDATAPLSSGQLPEMKAPQEATATTPDSGTSATVATGEVEEATAMTSPDPAGGLDLERSATPLPATEEEHPDPLAVPQPLNPTVMAGVEDALEKAEAENLGETPAALSTDGLPTADEAVAGAEQIVSSAQTTGELPATSPLPDEEAEESPTNPSGLPQPAASNTDTPLNPQAMADINSALGSSADSLGTLATAAASEGLPGASSTATNDETLATGGADMLGTTPSTSAVSENAEDGLDASAAVAEAGNIVTGQSISGASPSSVVTPSEDQGNSGAGTPPTPVTA